MMNYTANIFEASGSDLDPHTSAIIVAGIQIIGVYCATNLVDRVGRRVLLLFSTSGAFLGLTCLGTYSYLSTSGMDLSTVNWIPLVSFSTFVFISCFGILPLPFIITAEVLPPKVSAIDLILFAFRQKNHFYWKLLFFFCVPNRFEASAQHCAWYPTVYSHSYRSKRIHCWWTASICTVCRGYVQPFVSTAFSSVCLYWKRLRARISMRSGINQCLANPIRSRRTYIFVWPFFFFFNLLFCLLTRSYQRTST